MNVIAMHNVAQISANQNPDKARWLENYVKHGAKSFGVGIPEFRGIIQNMVASRLLTASVTE
jgi:hypothetical protein